MPKKGLDNSSAPHLKVVAIAIICVAMQNLDVLDSGLELL